MKESYHLNLKKSDIQGAQFAFLPGDPYWVPKIAVRFDANEEKIRWKKECQTYLGTMDGEMILVTLNLKGRR